MIRNLAKVNGLLGTRSLALAMRPKLAQGVYYGYRSSKGNDSNPEKKLLQREKNFVRDEKKFV